MAWEPILPVFAQGSRSAGPGSLYFLWAVRPKVLLCPFLPKPSWFWEAVGGRRGRWRGQYLLGSGEETQECREDGENGSRELACKGLAAEDERGV